MKIILFLLLALSLYAQSEPFIAHWPIIQQDCCNCPEEKPSYSVEYQYYIPIDDMPNTFVIEYEYLNYKVEYIYYDKQRLSEMYGGINFYQTNYSGRKDDDRFRESSQYLDR